MFELLGRIFDTSDFNRRWDCGNWSPLHGWIHIASDVAVWGAYTAIPCVLGYFVLRRKDVPFPRVFWLFAAFIFACGSGHLVEAAIFWWPAYRLSAAVKVITAIVSWGTVLALIPVTRQAITLRSPGEFEQANRLLSESEERTRQIIETAHDAFIAMDAHGTITGWNRHAEVTFGWTRAEALGRKFVDTIVPPQFRDAHLQSVAQFFETGESPILNRRIEITAMHRDGREFPVELTISPMRWRETHIFNAFVHDITERKRGEERFRQLLESAPDAMVIVNAKGSITLVNAQAERLFGYPRHELLGADVEFLMLDRSQEDRPGGRSTFSENLRKRPSSGGELSGQRKDGSEFPIEITLNPIQTETEHLMAVAIRDITERKRVELTLAEKNRQLLQSERLAAIGEMVTGLAHESRNALQRSQACLDMLVYRVQGQPKVLELTERIQDAQNRLQHLYEQVREYAAPIHLKRQRCRLNEIVSSAWKSLYQTRRDRSVIFDQQTEGFDLICHADAFALEQVFRNLLENSLSVSGDPVEIQIRWSLLSWNGRAAWQASLRDNGPGFAPELRCKVFQPFFTTKTKGTGLGLPISKRIVESHGGTLELGTDAGPGAEIIIILPRESGDVA